MTSYQRIYAVLSGLLLSGGLMAQPASFTNVAGMEFVLIRPGTMVVGRFEPVYPKPGDKDVHWTDAEFKLAEKLARQDARPGFPVTIRKPYYIGRFEVTQRQWMQVTGRNPSVFQGDKVAGETGDHPVENITWADAQAFVAKLNQLDKVHRYRLPTEFEWEYAARAGAEGDISWKTIWQTAQTGTRTTNKVGQKPANAWGLYDTLGNVWEWVQDWYNDQPFADPVPQRMGRQHVLKGASFVGDVKNATYMTHAAGPANGWDVGVRIVMEVNIEK
nr:formylglycine-generating enzyme family protein [uncultured Arsenicibacter sp.]